MAYAKYARDGDSGGWTVLSGGRMIVRFQKENLLLEAEDTLVWERV